MGKWVAFKTEIAIPAPSELTSADDISTLLDQLKPIIDGQLKAEMMGDPMVSVDIFYDPHYGEELTPV